MTWSDSGTLVMCTMLSMGDEHPPVKFRIFWGLTAGVVAGVLMMAGGLSASIVAGLPIAVILLFMIYGIVHALHEDNSLPDVEDKYELKFLNRLHTPARKRSKGRLRSPLFHRPYSGSRSRAMPTKTCAPCTNAASLKSYSGLCSGAELSPLPMKAKHPGT